MFFDTFFPATETHNNIQPNFKYPPNAFELVPITIAQIKQAIDKLNLFKAPGPNGIPNIIIKQCTDTLLPYC